jgi:hypothetical protein
MKLVERQDLVERRLLGIIVAGKAMSLGQVHPQGRRRGVCRSGRCEVFDRLAGVTSLKSGEAERIARLRMIGVDAQGLSAQ